MGRTDLFHTARAAPAEPEALPAVVEHAERVAAEILFGRALPALLPLAGVLDAYGLPADASEQAILAHLLALNLERAG